MPRDLAAGFNTELVANPVRLRWFIEAEFRTGWLRLWTGYGEITWSGRVWNGANPGASGVLQFEAIEETTGMEATGLRAILTGIESTLLAKCLDELRVGRKCRIYLGAVDSAGAIVDAPYNSFSGTMDAGKINEGGDTSTITITAENDLIRLARPKLRLLTLADQQTDFSTDTFFRHANSASVWKGVWGNLKIGGPPVIGGGGGDDYIDPNPIPVL